MERFGPLSVLEDVSNSAIIVSKPRVIIVRLRQCNGTTSKRVIGIERISAGAKCAYLEYGLRREWYKFASFLDVPIADAQIGIDTHLFYFHFPLKIKSLRDDNISV